MGIEIENQRDIGKQREGGGISLPFKKGNAIMKLQQITIFIKGQGLKTLNRKELIDFFDNEVMAKDEIEIVEVQY